jgi:molybdopterin-binding protein
LPGRGEVGAGGQRIASSITLEAVSDLGIAERSDVSAVVKVSDVMIAIGD